MGITHKWNGSVLTITSDSGSTAADLRGPKGDTGPRGPRGLQGPRGGGAAIEDNYISTETTWSSSGIMDRFAEVMGYNGNPVVCEPLNKCPLTITSEMIVKQYGSGEVYAPKSRKNKFDSGICTGQRLADTGNLYKETPYKYFATEKIISVESGATYTLSWEATITTTDLHSIAYYLDGVFIERIVQHTKTFTVPANANEVSFNWYDTAGTKHTSVPMFNVQLEKGTTATAYEAVSNIRPFRGFSDIKLSRGGKNLTPFAIGGNTFTNAGVSGVFDDTGIIVNGKPTTDYAKIVNEEIVLPKGNYYVSGGTFTKAYLQVSATYQGGVVKHYSNTAFMLTGEETKIQVMIQTGIAADTGTLEDYRLYPMLVVGSEMATAYEPYKAEVFTMSFDSKIYQGLFDWNTGKVIVDRWGLEFNGTENWTLRGTNEFRYNMPYGGAILGTAGAIESSHYIPTKSTYWDGMGDYQCGNHGFLLGIKDSNYSTVDEWKAYLAEQAAAGTPIQILYELTEPLVYDLEGYEIKAIEGTNVIYSNTDSIALLGRVDTMAQLTALAARVAALEAALAGGE